MENLEHANITIHDVSGKQVAQHSNYSGEAISVSALKNGAYFIRIEQNGTYSVGKFIKN